MGLASDAAQWPAQGLDEQMLAPDPHDQFDTWMSDVVAAELPEPTAVVLATVSAAGQPRARMVLLKSHDEEGFVFYTNRTSRKGADLDEVPRACLLFPWHAIHRQVIVEGVVTKIPDEASDAYFRVRPRASQLAAWASRQSAVISSRGELDDRYAVMERRWPAPADVPRPDFWGGYLVVPQTFEFWHGRANRMHDRLRYSRHGDAWLIERLAP
jgi:pyridoxamine 5'-phosphate oxidase